MDMIIVWGRSSSNLIPFASFTTHKPKIEKVNIPSSSLCHMDLEWLFINSFPPLFTFNVTISNGPFSRNVSVPFLLQKRSRKQFVWVQESKQAPLWPSYHLNEIFFLRLMTRQIHAASSDLSNVSTWIFILNYYFQAGEDDGMFW